MYQTKVYDEDNDDVTDVAIWFVSNEVRDEWFAYGLTIGDDAVPSMTDWATINAFFDDLPTGAMSVMLPLAGHPWRIVEHYPVQHAQSQRNIYKALVQDTEQMSRFMRMTEAELRAFREDANQRR